MPVTNPFTRRRLLGSCAAAVAGPWGGGGPALSATLESPRWRGLSIRYPPGLLRPVRPAPGRAVAGVPAAGLAAADGDLEVAIDADDAAVGSAGEYVRLDLAAVAAAGPPLEVTYRARGPGWEVASGFAGGRVFYFKAVEVCPGGSCGAAVPVVSNVAFGYAAAGKAAHDRLLERMVRTLTPATGRRPG